MALMESSNEKDIAAKLVFLARSEIYKTEKPYQLHYEPAKELNLPLSNITKEGVDDVPIRDLRSHTLSFKENGIEVVDLNSQMTAEGFDDESKIESIYLPEVEKCLLELLSAKRVVIIEYLIRKRHSKFPFSTGKPYDYNQPIAVAHIDYTLEDTEITIKNIMSEEADEAVKQHFQAVNVWKPLRGPLHDWPLALCDASSLDVENDLVPADIVYPTYVAENLQVHYNSKQRWHYLSGQKPTELLVFREVDSDLPLGPGVPHCSFKHPYCPPNEEPRESVEVRTLVFY